MPSVPGPGQQSYNFAQGLRPAGAEQRIPMAQSKPTEQEQLLEKIRRLTPERLAEVEDFVDFLRHRDEERRLTGAAARLSEEALARVWVNADDADYDRCAGSSA